MNAPRFAQLLTITVALAPVATSAATAAAAERLDIVDRAIALHGGERYRASETELDVCSRSGCFHVRARVDGERFDHTVSGTVRGETRTVRITNDGVELRHGETATTLDGDDAQAMRDWAMARIYFPFLPYRLNDPSVYKEDLGLERRDGRALHKVKITFTPGSSTDADDEYLYWLDPASGRVEYLAYSYRGNPGGLRYRKAINHRRVGGILFFDQENWGAEGDRLRVEQLTPDFVAGMRHVSTVTLRDIAVRPLGE